MRVKGKLCSTWPHRCRTTKWRASWSPHLCQSANSVNCWKIACCGWELYQVVLLCSFLAVVVSIEVNRSDLCTVNNIAFPFIVQKHQIGYIWSIFCSMCLLWKRSNLLVSRRQAEIPVLWGILNKKLKSNYLKISNPVSDWDKLRSAKALSLPGFITHRIAEAVKNIF